MNILFLFFVNSLMYFYLEDSNHTYDRYAGMNLRFEAMDKYAIEIGSQDKDFPYPILKETVDNPFMHTSFNFGHKIYLTPRIFTDYTTTIEIPRTQYAVAYDQFGDGLLNPSYMRWFFSEAPSFKAKLGYRFGQQREMVSGKQNDIKKDSFIEELSNSTGNIILEPYIFYAIGSIDYEDSSSYAELRMSKSLSQMGLGLEASFYDRSYALVLEYSTYNVNFEGMNALPYYNVFTAQKYYFGFKYNFDSIGDKLRRNRIAAYNKVKLQDTISPEYRYDSMDEIRESLNNKEREELEKKREKYIY